MKPHSIIIRVIAIVVGIAIIAVIYSAWNDSSNTPRRSSAKFVSAAENSNDSWIEKTAHWVSATWSNVTGSGNNDLSELRNRTQREQNSGNSVVNDVRSLLETVPLENKGQ